MPTLIPVRYMWWPIRLRWQRASSHRFFTSHGWQTGFDRVAPHEHSDGCMPGYRSVFGRTFHLGPLKVCFGKDLTPSPPKDLR